METSTLCKITPVHNMQHYKLLHKLYDDLRVKFDGGVGYNLYIYYIFAIHVASEMVVVKICIVFAMLLMS